MKRIRFTIWMLTVLILILAAGCGNRTETATPENIQSGSYKDGSLLKGVSFSPRSFQGKDFQEFLDRVKETQDLVLWAGDWIEIDQKKAPITVTDLGNQYGVIPIIEVGHYSQESGELFRPFTDETRHIYRESTLEFVHTYQPAYFGMGVEINIFAEKNPQAFEEFVPFYNELYDAIKQISPETKVFTVFQLENIKGLGFWEISKAVPHWEMMDRFKLDLAAFTTYPGLVYRDVADIPANHYSEIREHTSQPIAFMEIGWHSAASPAGWESSQEEQAEFIRTFFGLTQHLPVEVAIWSFMYDIGTFEPFKSMGLIDAQGNEKIAWGEWVK
jgi:hypothetical protein